MKFASDLFKALGDETRLRIMLLLLDGQEYCVCDFMEVLELPQSTASRHLAYLKNSGWLVDRRQNKWNYYCLNPDITPLARDLVPVLRKFLPESQLAVRDRKNLKQHIATKKKDAC